ncbi:BC10 family protein [archaeon]|nr:BC10 family protein [archaeon]
MAPIGIGLNIKPFLHSVKSKLIGFFVEIHPCIYIVLFFIY